MVSTYARTHDGCYTVLHAITQRSLYSAALKVKFCIFVLVSERVFVRMYCVTCAFLDYILIMCVREVYPFYCVCGALILLLLPS